MRPSRNVLIGFGFVMILLLGWFALRFSQFFRMHQSFEPAAGGVYTETTVGELRNLNPLASKPTPLDQVVHKLLFRGLLEYNPETGQIEDALADYRVSEDGTKYTITLKSTAAFSNGDSVTTDDVIFTYSSVIAHPDFENAQLRELMEYTTITALDDKTLTFEIPEPYFYFPSALTVPVLHAQSFTGAFIEEITDPDYPSNRAPTGTGPFMLSSIIPSDSGTIRLFFKKNPHYYEKAPYIEQAVFTIFPDYHFFEKNPEWSTAFSWLPPSELKVFNARMHEQYIERSYVLPRWTGVFFQLDQPNMARNALRQALALSVPKKDLIEDGWGTIESPFFFDGVIGKGGYDPAGARALLRDGGIRYDSETKLRKVGEEPLQLRFLTSREPAVYAHMGQKLATHWRTELDIDVQFQALPQDEFLQALEAREYDVLLYGQNFGSNFDTLGVWHSEKSGDLNLSNLTNNGIDLLIYDIQRKGAQEDIFELSKRIDNLLPAVPIATPTYAALIAAELKGLPIQLKKPRTHADRFWGMHNWYFEERAVWNEAVRGKVLRSFFAWQREK